MSFSCLGVPFWGIGGGEGSSRDMVREIERVYVS